MPRNVDATEQPVTGVPVEVVVHAGDRAPLMPLFRLADDSERAIAGYFGRGTLLVAKMGGEIVGIALMLEGEASATWELKSLAVLQARRHTGVGRRLVEAGLAHARGQGAGSVAVATAAADTGLLRFYQRLGFRMTRIERDAFTPDAGYPPDLFADGVRILDRVWLDHACA
jgi:GNAT superfamily N-acetyltransferase